MVPSFTQASMSKEPPTPNPDIDPSHTKGFFFVGAVVGGEPASFFQIVQIRKKSGISFFCHSQQVRSVFFEENQFGCCPPPPNQNAHHLASSEPIQWDAMRPLRPSTSPLPQVYISPSPARTLVGSCRLCRFVTPFAICLAIK